MALNLHGISEEAFDLIVDEEVSSRAAYEARYKRPEKPGGASGVTVGIGYDCGYYSADQIRKDWNGLIPFPMVEALAACAGIKGDAAFAACRRAQGIVNIPWEAAIDVFSNVSLPKYDAATRHALPNFDKLHAHCKGVLDSLTYNRGASYTLQGDRYLEMRQIRVAMTSENYGAIPALLRKMKRLWQTKSVRGVALRREHEAHLFELGLQQTGHAVAAVDTDGTGPYEDPTATERTPVEPSTPGNNVRPQSATYSAECEVVQRRLLKMNYFPGGTDGEWGGHTAGAVTSFYNDRGIKAIPELGPQLNDALDDAEADNWTRPIAPERANAKPEDLVSKNESVRMNLMQRFWAKIGTVATGLGFTGATLPGLFQTTQDKLSTVQTYFASVPASVWFLLALAICGAVWYATNRAAKATARDFNIGRLK